MHRPVGLVVGFALLAGGWHGFAADQVVFKDGFTVIGRRITEQEMISDKQTGTAVKIVRNRGFDCIEVGAKWYLFSNRTPAIGKIIENVISQDGTEYKRDTFLTGRMPLPGVGLIKVPEFNDQWDRSIRVEYPETKSFAIIKQSIHTISPKRVVIPSTNYSWYPFYDTKEFKPEKVKNYLLSHPDLKQDPTKPEPEKLLKIALFFKDAGWYDDADAEIAALRTVVQNPTKDFTEQLDKLAAEIRKARTAIQVNDFEAATRNGLYETAKEIVAKIDDTQLDAGSARVLTTMRAQVETAVPRCDKAKALLRWTIDEPGKAVPANLAILKAAGEQLIVELHPDTTDKLDFFISLADQAKRKTAAGQDAGVKAEQLLALAVTGWLKGKNGAEQDTAAAVRYWNWRSMLLAYSGESVLNRRRELLDTVRKEHGPLPIEEIAQIIALLPPSQPENLKQRTGEMVSPGIYRRNTGDLPELAKGIDYLVRLPKEYHHGKPSRLMLVLAPPHVTAREVMDGLAADADRHGTILAAPAWANDYEPKYDYKGDQHFKALAVLRSVRRHFRIDDDRVFVFGFGEGANFAMDLGASHPDRFAGVVAMGANPKNYNMFMYYWRNFQKLPLYLIIGSMDGMQNKNAVAAQDRVVDDAFTNMRTLFGNMMPKAFPTIGVVFRGRMMEWFPTEVPVLFDWMLTKKRVVGAAMLRVNEAVEPWMTMRPGDNRFYWVGTNAINPANISERPGRGEFVPAEIKADIPTGNAIRITARGLSEITIYFDRGLIDWTKPVSISLNGNAPPGWKARKIVPDIEFMLEQFHKYGDRSLLFWNKIDLKVTT